MSDTIRESTWLLTEHLRFTPLTLVDDIINSINALLYRAVSAVETGLLNAPAVSLGFKKPKGSSSAKDNNDNDNGGWYPEARLEIENGVHQLETLLEATVDKDFDKLEIYVLRNVLAVPEDVAGWVRLGHYENINFSPPKDAPTFESIDVQRRQLDEARKLHRSLSHESKRNAVLIAQLQSLLPSSTSSPPTVPHKPELDSNNISSTSPFAFLTTHPSAQTLRIGSRASSVSKPLTTTTSFAVSQLPHLRALLSSLRPKLATATLLSSSTDEKGKRDDDVEMKRSMYIETQTRRHLEMTRALNLDENGAVKDAAEWLGPGRKIASDEVRSLENLVDGLKTTTRERAEGADGRE